MILDDFGGLDEGWVNRIGLKYERRKSSKYKVSGGFVYDFERMFCLIWNPGVCKYSDAVWRAHTALINETNDV